MPTITLTFLAADRPLTKKFVQTPSGIEKEPYPKVWDFTSETLDVESLSEFAEKLELMGMAGRCLLKGNVQRPLIKESRAGSTDANTPTNWVCLDIDRMPGVDLETFLGLVGLANVSYVVQYSSSYLIEVERGLTAHVFMQLDREASPALLKAWLIDLNLNTPTLTKNLRLTRTGNALSFPLDTTTCQNDKLLYIAPPVLEGLEDPLAERVQHVRKTQELLSLPDVSHEALLRTGMEAWINELRESTGLPKRKFAYKQFAGVEVMGKPDAARLTGIKAERGFVYLNLNGGDSWGYYHSVEKPEVIFNFKGEPNYRTQDLLPEYWAQLQGKEAEKQDEVKARGFVDDRILVFRDFESGLYYNGTYDKASGKLELAIAKSETQIQHFLLAHKLPEVDFIPIWRVSFDPASDVRVDFARQRINLFEPTRYMKQAEPVDAPFPTIQRVIEHAVARDPGLRGHFLNWLAGIWQLRSRMLTAWILHGVEGTGKGVLFNHVLAPLFGRRHTIIKRMSELEDQFNQHLEQALLVVIDEAQISESKRDKMVMADVKNLITEPTITIRRMRSAAYSVRNFSNWLFFSNMPDPVTIGGSDRRFNVGEFRREKLILSDAEIGLLGEELPAFASFLSQFEVDLDKARTVFQTEERTNIQQASRTSGELVAEALQKGMLEAFWEELPNGDTSVLPPHQAIVAERYVDIVHRMVRGESDRIARDDLRVLFHYLCGDVPSTPTKFTQFLRHKGVNLRNMQINGRVCRGFEVQWQVDPEWLAARRVELEPKIKEKRAA